MDLRAALQVAVMVLAGLGGGGVIVILCASWLGKVWANRILEADRLKYGQELERLRGNLEAQCRVLQGELDKAIHVHRVQFETEFRALSDIWAKLSVLRSAMGELRPTMDIVDPDEEPQERLRRHFRMFQEAFSDFVRAVDDQSPFYAEEIFQELSAALQIARRELMSISIEDPEQEGVNWYKEGAANFEALVQSSSRVSALIRKRLESLQVHS
jgi:hypothetical protein